MNIHSILIIHGLHICELLILKFICNRELTPTCFSQDSFADGQKSESPNMCLGRGQSEEVTHLLVWRSHTVNNYVPLSPLWCHIFTFLRNFSFVVVLLSKVTPRNSAKVLSGF